jgi:hypothetical protein
MQKISPEIAKEIVHCVVRILGEQIAATGKERYDNRRTYMKKLLRNYRAFVAGDANIFSGEDAQGIVTHFERVLDLYKEHCDHSKCAEDARRFRILFWAYIASAPKTLREIARGEVVNMSTVSRDIDRAIDCLMVLFFGVDGVPLHAI